MQFLKLGDGLYLRVAMIASAESLPEGGLRVRLIGVSDPMDLSGDAADRFVRWLDVNSTAADAEESGLGGAYV